MRVIALAVVVLTSSIFGYGQDCSKVEACSQILEMHPKSSIAHYRIAEILFAGKHYQQAANAFRSALNGDLEPRWVKVWSYVALGKIFDVAASRDRAVVFYQLALTTRDNTRGAIDEPSKYLKTPFADVPSSPK